MTPVPLESQPTPTLTMQNVPPSGGGSISLAMLIDFILQRTYHELSVLAELLPRKTDMERKIEIIKFANCTRQMFVRLLALVKWANSASKVDKCTAIMGFLDKQSILFVETADMLSRLSRDTLVRARLPNFQLPCAVEVLTTGSYMRMPTCIRERIVPSDPINAVEKRSTLLRLNQIIQHRLVTSADLPPQMRNLKIENGRVTFQVEHEFEVSLTLMGDSIMIPWRLLDIHFLVEDKETDGKALVHPLQVLYIHQLAQSRLLDTNQPLHDLYSCLHSFSQSLQLEVLYSQIFRLSKERLGDFIKVEEYMPGKRLTISFWRELASKSEVEYKLSVRVDPRDGSRPLQLVHTPPLTNVEAQQADQAIKSDHLSIERLLVHTMHVRTKQRLNELKDEIQTMLGSGLECITSGSPAVLSVPVLQPCLRSEQLLITIDTHTGMFLAHVPQFNAPMISDIQQTLNSDRSRFSSLIADLRFWIMLRRCEKTIQHMPAVASEKLPLVYPANHPLAQLSPYKMFIKLCKHPNCYVIVELKGKRNSCSACDEAYYLLVTKPTMFDECDPSMLTGSMYSASGDGNASKEDMAHESGIPKAFLGVQSLTQFDTFTITHGPYTKVDVSDPVEKLLGKRKGGGKPVLDTSSKRPKYPAYFLPNLAHVIALCDERIHFATLTEELNRYGICHQGMQVEAGGVGLAVRIVQMPDCKGVEPDTMDSLRRGLLSCTIRVQGKGNRSWIVEYAFCKCPLTSIAPKEQGPRRMVYFMYDMMPVGQVSKVIEDFLADWNAIAHLYKAVLDFVEAQAQDQYNSLMMEVKSYSYKRLILGYGPNRANTISIAWNSNDKRFYLSFGITGPTASATNPHTLTAGQIQHLFNAHKSIYYLAQMLQDTYPILNAISKLPTSPLLGLLHNRMQVPVTCFTIMPQSPTHIRIVFRGMYCIDVQCHDEGTVAVRDGAHSLFDNGKVVDDLTPTQGLKAFLLKFVDESVPHMRRRSNSEDDNPPSPEISIDPLDSFMSGHPKPNSPAQRPQEPGLRFHHPMTPPMASNPHTPSSPHTVLSQNYTASPATSFSLASPPSLQHNINPSPSMMHMGTPSPGNLLAANSPSNPLHVPSPGSFMPTPSPSSSQVHLQSPASSFIGPQGHADAGSPFPSGQSGTSGLSMPSPATQQWPGSPSMPRPSPAGRNLGPAQSPGGHPILHSPQSAMCGDYKPLVGLPPVIPGHSLRVLPQRSWAAAIPTIISQEAFEVLCTPAQLPGMPQCPTSCMVHSSPLERFLGCVSMRRCLQRCIQTEEFLTHVPNSESGVILFKVESFQCRVNLHALSMQSLHLKLTPHPELKDQWISEELQVLEKFFETKVVCSPYKPNALLAFLKILNAPLRILKDCIQIMRLEMMPDRNLKWSVQWCLTIPPAAPPIAPGGSAAVVIIKTKLLFFIQLTRIGINFPAGTEPQTVVLPIVYDMSSNSTQLADRREPANMPPTSVTAIIMNTLKRFAEFNQKPGECSILPAVRELMANLVIPM